jgi:DNA-binding CsgD family transcriptional regulator
MLAFVQDAATNRFTARNLMDLTGVKSLSTVRRGLEGLLIKLSIDKRDANRAGRRDNAHEFRAYSPNEIIARRRERGSLGFTVYAQETPVDGNHSFSRVIFRVAENPMLSRREAQVALFCVQGLTNAVIGERLSVSEQTVKFHLRHIFLKFGVKRRAELISKLLM